MQPKDLEWKMISPPAQLTDFVESFWMITNHTDKDNHIIIIPDGRFDIIFSLANNDFRIVLRGLDTQPGQAIIPAKTTLYSFQYMAHGAQYVMIGLQKGDICFSHPEFHKREGTLMSSRNATRQDFEHVIYSMKKGEVKPTTYITHSVAFDRVKR